MIPCIDIGPLFSSGESGREKTDREIYHAAREVGFLRVRGAPFQQELSPARRKSLLRIFDLSESERRRLWKKNFASENPNLYRGFFPLHSGPTRCREGFEIGPDVIRPLSFADPDDLLWEPSVFPAPNRLPDWHSHAADYYSSIEIIGERILASLSRGLGIDEEIFAEAFRDGISTLRLLHYPALASEPGHESAADANRIAPVDRVQIGDRSFEVVTAAHLDTGLLTLVAGCGVPGLQAETDSGEWVDVDIPEDGFAVNFGGLLSRWTGSCVRATMHRVLSLGGERFSIPFFFEPRPETVIAPLPIPGADAFEPFLFGDHLWATTTQYPENYGLEDLRPPRAPYRDPWRNAPPPS
jgi:isopenicillin N synthase-like dioxygenase